MITLKIFTLSIKLPLNIFIFIWCAIGVVVLVTGFIDDFINYSNYEFTLYSVVLQIAALYFFSWYCISYIKQKNNRH